MSLSAMPSMTLNTISAFAAFTSADLDPSGGDSRALISASTVLFFERSAVTSAPFAVISSMVMSVDAASSAMGVHWIPRG